MNRKEHAVQLHQRKYNCAQAVACTFADLTDLDEKTVFRAAEAFGFGMGSMKTCGVLSGAALIIGLLNSDGNLENPSTKKVCYAIMEQVVNAFEEKHGSTVCADLKSESGVPSCDRYIEDAVDILEAMTQKR